MRSLSWMSSFIIRTFLLIFSFILSVQACSQWNFCAIDSSAICLSFSNQLARDSIASISYTDALNKAFFSAHLVDRDTSTTELHYGEQYSFQNIAHLDSLLSMGRFTKKEQRNIRENGFQPQLVSEIAERLLSLQEQNGHPFARLSFVPHKTKEGIRLEAYFDKGPRVYIDSLIIKSKSGIRAPLIEKLLQLSQGDIYNEKQLQGITKQINKVPYLQSAQSPQLVFSPKGAKVFLFVEKKAANRFDGMIGFQPDPNTEATIITGDINLDLQNTLQQGERLRFQWRRLQAEVQELDIGINFPYLAQTSLGIGGELEIYRRDSTFSTTRLRGELIWMAAFEKELGGFIERWNSNQLGTALGVEDVSITRYGLRSKYVDLDDRLNPLNGIDLSIEGSAGLKTRKQLDIDQEVEEIESTQVAASLRFLWHKKIIGNLGIGGRVIAEKKWDESVLTNEQFRVGGLNSLRGFNEEGIFTEAYSIVSVHLKYRFDSNSGAFVFYDQGWTQGNELIPDDRPYGFGAGVNFGTKNGVFSLVYALGSQFNQALLLRDAKIHFGFVNLF